MIESGPHSRSRVFSSAQDVFCYFRDQYGVDGYGGMNAIALFAYALVEKDRVDWSEHVAASTAAIPDHAQIEGWFRSKPEAYFDEIEVRAYRWFSGFVRSLLHDEIEQNKRDAVKSALGGVHEELGNLRKFWPAFWAGNLVGITSNIAFTGLVLLFVVYISTDCSFIAWTKHLLTLANTH